VALGAVEPALVNASSDNTEQAPTTSAEAPLIDLTAASAASNDPATVALPELKQAVPVTAQSSPVQPTVAASPSAQVDEPIEPALIAPTVVASAASAAEPDAPAQMTEGLAALMPRRPAANEAPAAEAVMNFIDVGPRIGQDEPPLQPSQIDKDSLLTRITNEAQGDNSVLYKLDNEPAFVDRGSRLEMAPGAGQSDEKILAALLTAARFYRGQIELTGSDAFKAKAIELIAQNQVNVSMKNPAQQLMLDQSRQALNLPVVKADAIHGDTPAPFDPAPPATPAMSVATAGSTAPTTPAVAEQQAAPTPVATSANNTYVPLGVSDPITLTHNAAQGGPVDDAPPLGAARQTQEIKPAVVSGDQATGTGVDAAIHQLSTSAAQGVTGKVLSCGKAPFRFDPENSESVHIKLRTKTGVQTFWGKELAGLLRDTRIEPGRMATLQYLGEKPVTVKTPVKDPDTGLVLHYEDKQAKRNQWSLGLLNGTAVRMGDDQGVKLVAYDAARFDMIQKSIMTQLNVPIDAPPRPADGLFWMTPNGQGSARAGDELSAPRPQVDTVDVGKPVMSSWSQDGQLDMALFRGDGPYLQGVMRQGNEYQHVLVSLPGHAEAPPMVINQITDQGLVPIGVGNGINRSGGEPVAREHIAFKIDGDPAVRIGKLDFPAEVPPALHVRLGFDERWKDTNTLPKSAPAAAPMAEPSAVRPS
jgi:putative DNA primase/helicase